MHASVRFGLLLGLAAWPMLSATAAEPKSAEPKSARPTVRDSAGFTRTLAAAIGKIPRSIPYLSAVGTVHTILHFTDELTWDSTEPILTGTGRPAVEAVQTVVTFRVPASFDCTAR